VTIPNSVASIGTSVFTASSLTSVYFNGKPPTCGSYPFLNVSANARGYYSAEYRTEWAAGIVGGRWQRLSREEVGDDFIYSYDDWVFLHATVIGYKGSGGNVAIPASTKYSGMDWTVTGIGAEAFLSCTSLTSVTIPNSVTSIGEGAFALCSGLESVAIGNGVKSIEGYVFSGCANLTSMTIPNGVTSIGNYAFRDCIRLKSVTIPNGVTSIGKGAFSNCGLTSVTIPNGVTSIEEDTFYDCGGLTSASISSSVKRIGTQAFYKCHSLTEIMIPNGVTKIEYLTFYSCFSLTNIMIPDSVTSIGVDAFRSCTGLKRVILGGGVASLETGAFAYCVSLAEVYFYGKPPACGNGPFYEVPTNTRGYYLPGYQTEWWKVVDWEDRWNGLIMDAMIGPPGTVNVGNGLLVYFDDASLEGMVIGYFGLSRELEIPSSIVHEGKSYTVTSIADGAFADSGSVRVFIPGTIQRIGVNAFDKSKQMLVYFSGSPPLFIDTAPSAFALSDAPGVARGYYLPEHAAAWEAVIVGGMWNGLIMSLGVTQSGDVPVPFSWLAKYDLVEDDNYEAAATNLTGKGIPAWQEYLAGTDPTDMHDFFRITGISFSNSLPKFVWKPDLNTNGVTRKYTEQWTTNLSSQNVLWNDRKTKEPSASNFPIFRLTVEMP
jgi:hypothetical protein